MQFYVNLLFLFSGVLFTLTALAWGCRTISRNAYILIFFLVAEGFTCFAYGMNIVSETLDAKLFWNHLEYLFGGAVAPLMPILVLHVMGYEKRLPTWFYLVLFTVPVLGTLLNWTWSLHLLFYSRVWLEPVEGGFVLTKERGPLYALVFAHVFGLIILANVLFFWRVIRHRFLLTWEQVSLTGIAVLAPFVFGVPYYWLDLPWLKAVNTVHIGFFLTALMFSIIVLQGRLKTIIRSLDESAMRNQFMLSHANAIFYTITAQGRFSYISPSCQSFLGHCSHDMVGHDYREVMIADDVDRFNAFLTCVVKRGSIGSGVEYRVRHKDGSIRWHTSSIKPVLDKQGNPVTFVGIAHDITFVKKAQDELRAVNHQLGQLIARRESELREAVAEALHASEGETRRIGREIHDTLCQELVGVLRMTEGVVKHCDTLETKRSAQKSVEQIGQILGMARRISYDLSLHDLEVLSLCEALSVFAKRFEDTSAVEIEVNCAPEHCIFSPSADQHIYRFVREAVVNALRHGEARHIWIDVVCEKTVMIVSITNDGKPLPEEAELRRGIGLKQMHMRAQQVGGTFRLQKNSDGKTVAELTIPLHAQEVCHGRI
jgi:PAS domain S-box-containing protein